MREGRLNSMDVLGVRVSVLNLPLAAQVISQWIEDQWKTYICVVPVSTIVECQKDERYRTIVNNAGMATPDGMPLVWLGRLSGCRDMRRTYGPDLMLSLCELSQERGYRHFFYGGSAETSKRLQGSLKEQFPHLNIVGRFSPPARSLHAQEDPQVLEEINQSQADILWVGLGSPKQDFWMAEHRSRLTVPVMIGVGAAFDFLAKTKRQAPRWVRQTGMEWFFRLCCEPRRLWKRYLLGNSQFIFFLMKSYLKNLLDR